MKRKLRFAFTTAVILLCGGLVVLGARRLGRVAAAADPLPTATARQGEFVVIITCRGELKAQRSVQVIAPVNSLELRIVWLAATGSMVKAGDPIVRFDPSATQNQLHEKEAALAQAQASLDQAIADAHISGEQGKLDLASAEYQLERSKLEASKAEVVSALQAEESRVDLGLAEQKLTVQKSSTNLDRVSAEAKISSLTRARDKAREEVNVTKDRLKAMERTAPLTGMVNYLPNYSQGWINAKPFKVGDQAWPGAAVAEIPDLDTLEMEGKIEEIDRGRMAVGQDVRLRIDALPETVFASKLVLLSPLTVMGWEWPPTRTFRGYAKPDKPDSRLRPGMNGAMDVVMKRIPNAISIPSKALFTRNGKPIVYVEAGGQYVPTEVQVLARNPDEVAIRGIANGTKVTLVEPEKRATTKAPSSAKKGHEEETLS